MACSRERKTREQVRIQEEVVGPDWRVPQTVWSSTPAGSDYYNEQSVPLLGTGPRPLPRPSTGRENVRMRFPRLTTVVRQAPTGHTYPRFLSPTCFRFSRPVRRFLTSGQQLPTHGNSLGYQGLLPPEPTPGQRIAPARPFGCARVVFNRRLSRPEAGRAGRWVSGKRVPTKAVIAEGPEKAERA
ncbi:helix-turn-helix domain-containing protein [Streptomyces sp. NPDC002668]|uniref:helix-turn-helix domain-containing protein n=1 Tax=Streptomyces sp. NPDC002668 TaxID=3154422 RepID=UPI003321FF11